GGGLRGAVSEASAAPSNREPRGSASGAAPALSESRLRRTSQLPVLGIFGVDVLEDEVAANEVEGLLKLGVDPVRGHLGVGWRRAPDRFVGVLARLLELRLVLRGDLHHSVGRQAGRGLRVLRVAR